MKKTICYRVGCNLPSRWKIPGHPVTYLCTKHMRELLPDKVINVVEVVRLPAVGPTEFKENEHE